MGLSTFLRQRTASRVAAVALASVLAAGCMCATAFADEPGVNGDASSNAVLDSAVVERDAGIAAQSDVQMSSVLVADCTKDYAYAFEVLRLVNVERAKEGIAPLTMDRDLLDVAMKRSAEIGAYYSHTRPDGTSCFTIVPDRVYGSLGENIAIGQPTPAGIVYAWMNSAGHRANIMNPDFTCIGIGCLNYGASTFGYWVQLFSSATPIAASQPANAVVTEPVSVPASWIVSENFQFNSYLQNMAPGKTEQLAVRFLNQSENGSGYVLELAPSMFTYSVDNSSVATVSANGVVTAKKAGSTKVWASIPGTGVRLGINVSVAGNTGVWKTSSGKYWYSYSNGSYAKGWQQIDGKWYYFNGSGYMQTGWQKIGGSWYYLGGKSDGSMKTGWSKISGTWYYFKDSGAMATGWTKVGNTWYYMNGSGAMQTGWLKSGKTWYYLKGSGAMATGWQKVGGSWYYLKSSGAMATGWYQDGGTWYYSNGSGVMQKSKWVGNYYLQGSGAMATNKWVGQYYVGADGAWVRNA